MGIIKKYMNQTRRPEGTLGRLMIMGMNAGHAAMAAWGTSQLCVEAPASVLDIGCGGGSNLKALSEIYPDAKVAGVDYSPLSVESSAVFNQGLIAEGRCRVVQGDVSALPFEDGEFDLATAYETIYFWPGLKKCFAEVARVLGPDGVFMIVNEADGSDGASLKYEKIIDGMKVYSPEQIEYALKEAGFAAVRIIRHEIKPWITVMAYKNAACLEAEEKKALVKADLSIGAAGTDYRNWVPMGMIAGFCAGTAALAAANVAAWKMPVRSDSKAAPFVPFARAALGVAFGGASAMTCWCIMAYNEFSYDGKRKLSKDIVEKTADYVRLPADGVGLDVGCGSGALTIACAKRNPDARMVGVDSWGAEYASFSKKLCESNAAAEGVDNVSFRPGNAVKLPFADEAFDAVTSNYVYHNVVGADKQALLRETFRVLRKGGTFAIHDLMSKSRYGDMEAFAAELRDEGFEDVRLIRTDKGLFMPEDEAARMMLSESTLLVGKK